MNDAGLEEYGLRLEVTDRGDCRVLLLTGEMDVAMRGAQEAEFVELVATAPGQLAVIDLSGVSFCDSSGVGVLVSAARRLWAQNGTVRLTGPQPWVEKVLTITGVTRVMQVFPSVEDALAG